ncbi:hypothetical protein AIN02nite_28590 [Acetobacter indonesiensis]|uniref:Uncharacterized protein n=1 Tax=Acetobacter indonesiensis TaxID=104101 RepID=A0A6N3T9G5_9PROT|nr:hypothetical protein Abin_070_005 [Acetobacter indonesiensis]GEN04834.1 hypothetical protein AIN02nite_28590 [Acetobacter indonesiensis]
MLKIFVGEANFPLFEPDRRHHVGANIDKHWHGDAKHAREVGKRYGPGKYH